MRNPSKIKRIVLGLLVSAVVARLIYELFKKPAKIKTPADVTALNGNTTVYSGNVTVSSNPLARTLDITQVGQTSFSVTGLPTGINSGNFVLTNNGVLMINADTVEADDPFEYEVNDMGGGTYEIVITSTVLVLNPDLHTLVLTIK